jgi:carboxynorspermidine decarboxylase
MRDNMNYILNVPSPCYVCEESLLEKNLKILERVQNEAGVKILLALKGFSYPAVFHLIKKYLHGVCASGLHEARLGAEEFGREVHTYSPAYKDEEIEQIAKISHHLLFNSFAQLQKYKAKVLDINPNISIGLRINPECSTAPVELYNPCAPFSRFGITKANFEADNLEGVSGLHFHALCEQNVDAFEAVLDAFEENFGEYISQMKWINFGGGHHITRADYDVDRLIEALKEFKGRYPNLQSVYLEPGEAVGWQTGPLVASVLDIIHNGMDIAILDTSAEAHMPDTLAMPYRPMVRGSGEAGMKKYTYRFGGNTCLSGDIIGEYSFDEPLKIGDRVLFEDQCHYTFVKNTTFNGINLPSLAVFRLDGSLEVVRSFGYEDFKNKLM